MKFGIIGNTSKPALKDVSKNLLSFFTANNLPYVLHRDVANYLNASENQMAIESRLICDESDLANQCDMLVALGGDGTMLAAARLVGPKGIPILGVNLGKLGFLAEVSVDELEQCIIDILANNYFVQDRLVLQATGVKDKKIYYGLNEIVVDRRTAARVIDLETYVNDDYLVTYTADGLIVNTPTGSTAYSLASGGPIVVPESNVITINPIAPHTLTARPVIVPDGSIIRIVVNSPSKSVNITADGQVEGIYDTPAEFIVQKAPYCVKLVKRKKRTYYDLLRTKLLWGRDVRVGGNK